MVELRRSRVVSEQATGVMLVLVSALGYAWLPIFAKWAYAAGMSPVDLLTLRFAIAAPVMWAVTWQKSPGVPGMKMLGAGALFALVALTAFFSLSLIPSSLYTLLLYTYPAMVVLLSRLRGETISRQAAVALVLTLAGVALTVPFDRQTLAQTHPAGVALSLINAALYAVYILFSQRILAGQSAVAHATRWSITGSLAVMLVISTLDGLTLPQSAAGWASAAGMAVICTVLPIFTFLAGMKRLGASNASILSSIEPLATLALAVVLLGERLSWQQGVGGALILASVVVLQLRR